MFVYALPHDFVFPSFSPYWNIFHQPVMPCSANFTLRYYSVRIREFVPYNVTPDSLLDDNGNILVNLTGDSLPAGVTFDDSFLLTVTACSDITCRTSEPVVFSKCVYHEENGVCPYLRLIGRGGCIPIYLHIRFYYFLASLLINAHPRSIHDYI